MMDSFDVVLIAVGVAGLGLLAWALIARRRPRARERALQRRFGPEYERVVQEHGTTKGHEMLESRVRRVARMKLHRIGAAERSSLEAAWRQAEERFVDNPETALVAARDLVEHALRSRGYPAAGPKQRAEDLSVNHADAVQHYRAAHALQGSSHATTEELRQALVHYRAVFLDLVAESSKTRRRMKPATADSDGRWSIAPAPASRPLSVR